MLVLKVLLVAAATAAAKPPAAKPPGLVSQLKDAIDAGKGGARKAYTSFRANQERRKRLRVHGVGELTFAENVALAQAKEDRNRCFNFGLQAVAAVRRARETLRIPRRRVDPAPPPPSFPSRHSASTSSSRWSSSRA